MNPLLDLAAHPVVAHRGASGHAPENTLPAFQLAAEQGADAFELDVQISADGIPVVIHDLTLDRTTDRIGVVSAQTLVGLRQADAGAHFSPDRGVTYPWRGRRVRIPTLAEVLEAFPSMPMLVDIKDPRAGEAIRRVLLDMHATERVVVASEEAEGLDGFRDPPFRRAATSADIAALYSATMLRRSPPIGGYRVLSVPERYRGLPVPTRRFVTMARGQGCPVHVWTVNTALVARRLWDQGVAGIVTDFPDVIRPALTG